MAASPVRASEPLSDLVPDHPPDAVHEVALAADHVSVAEPPLATVVGVADSVTEGAAGCVTVTFTDCVVSPPAPVHVNAKAEVAANGPVDAVPEVALVPLQFPEAVQDVALEDDQVSVAAEPATTEDGAAASVTVGASGAVGGCETVATTVCPAVPPAPAQVRVYAVEALSAPVASVPVRPLVPLQPPDATQDEAFDDDQLRLAEAVF